MTDENYGWHDLPPLEKMPAAVAALWKLGPKGLKRYVMNNPWFVEADDLVGGWCITPLPFPPSTGNVEIAQFIHEDIARYIANLHNEHLPERQRFTPDTLDNRMPPNLDHGTISDGEGSEWPLCMPGCGLEVVRPGKVQCFCDDLEDDDAKMIHDQTEGGERPEPQQHMP